MKSESDILDKIRKLLRLADRSRGSTENEAKVALAKAQELMTRHNIDSALLRMERGESGGAGFTVNKGKVDLPKTLNPADLMILSILQAHFNVKTILMPNGRGTPVDIIGAAADIDFAIYRLQLPAADILPLLERVQADPRQPGQGILLPGPARRPERRTQSGEATGRAILRRRPAPGIRTGRRGSGGGRSPATSRTHYGKLRNRSQRRRHLHSGSYVAGETKGRTIQINRPLPS